MYIQLQLKLDWLAPLVIEYDGHGISQSLSGKV